MFQHGSPTRRQVPPPINTQPGPPIMRQGRFLSPTSGSGGGGGGGGGSMTPATAHGGYHPTQQQQRQQYYGERGSGGPSASPSPSYNYSNLQSALLSPTSQVRFQEETMAMHDQKQEYEYDDHEPTFLFEEGELSESDDDENESGDSRGGDGGGAAGGGVGGSTNTTNTNTNTPPTIPSEAQLALLCLDYLRDLRRSYHHAEDLLRAEGLNADYIALAAWSLSRAFVRPNKLKHGHVKISTIIEMTVKGKKPVETHFFGGGGLSSGLEDEPFGNDAWYRQLEDDVIIDHEEEDDDDATRRNIFALSDTISLPTMEDITDEILLCHPNEQPFPRKVHEDNKDDDEDDDDEDDEPFYDHNDGHFSNAHRFYLLNGLASDASSAIIEGLGGFPSSRSAPSNNANSSSGGPLSFCEIASAGLTSLRARSRIHAEKELVRNPLFQQFVQAASAGGFFQEKRGDYERGRMVVKSSPAKTKASVLTTSEEERRSRLLYEEKYRKIVNKFRTKLATKEAQLMQPSQHQQGYNHPPTSSPSRIRSAYRVMGGGNGSVSSGGNGSVSSSVVVGLESVMNAIALNNDVAERQRRRRERRMDRVKSERMEQTSHDRGLGLPGMDSMSDGLEEIPTIQQQKEEEQTRHQTQRTSSSSSSSSNQQQRTTPTTKPPKIPPSPASAANLPHYQEAERINTTGNSLMQQKHFQQALDTYTAALQLAPAGPNSHVYYSNRSAAYLSLNNYESSIRDSERSLALRPEYAKAHSRLGLAYFACGRYEEAIGAYVTALEIDPANDWSRDHLEKAREKLYESEAVSGNLVEQREEEVGEDEEEEESVTSDNWPSPFEDENTVQQEAGVHTIEEEEADTTDEEEEQDKEDDVAKRTRIADNHKDRGNEHMSSKEYEKALHQYNQAVQTSPSGPNSHVYYSNRAAAYCYMAEYQAASNDCRASIHRSPTYEKAHARLGLSLFFQGEYEGAIDAYNKSLELDPKNKASLSYLKKAKARWKEQRKKEEEEKKKEEEERKEEVVRRRKEWFERQQQSRYQQQQQRHIHYPDPGVGIVEEEEGEYDDDESSLGDNTGITSTGLTSIVTNDYEEEEKGVADDPRTEEPSSMDHRHQEAFDPFVTTDES